MIGARNVAFPRLNAYGYWVYLFGGALPVRQLLPQHRAGHRLVQLRPARRARNSRPGSGWTSGRRRSPSPRSRRSWRRWSSSSPSSRMRAPGMSLNRMPLFVWAMLVQAFMVLFAMPWVATASQFLAMDRLVAHPLLQPGRGGRRAALAAPVLVLRPSRGLHHLHARRWASCRSIVADVHAAAGVRLPGHGAVPDRAPAFLGFGLWVHHMFATGLPQLGESFFTAASMMIAIPSGIQIFCWIATIWAGRPRLHVPMLFVLGFVVRVRHRRPHRGDGGLGAVRPAGARHLLRRRALPLRADRRRRVSAVRRLLLLVPQGHRAGC